MKFSKLHDISVVLGEESIDFPGDTPFARELTWSVEEGHHCNLSRLSMSAHAGTHIDFPSHFLKDAKTIEHYPVEEFFMPAKVIETYVEGEITDFSCGNSHSAGGALLFKTYNSTRDLYKENSVTRDFVSLSLNAAELCVEKGIRLVGIDYITVEKLDNKGFPVHLKLLENDILILESINLKEVSPGDYTLMCFPLKIKGAEGAPVRAVLLE